ncbi:hypothetical protein GFS24_02280 [Chitinophaga sp. SYP-B3965]|uniref:hypothetical protein n=1 Tax=Chitinophaga sp. SYP-B3965 TaxID=2663120 RepID=UPI001299B4EF|nr:hypothetical protein [Chitinophaga sp. SYP-B3965]MRG43920.1 hypothetical protein [Chitinophaga sp. SYP-B3965]
MAKEKNKPISVRFDLRIMELLKEEEKIDTPQKALNFLSNYWENTRPAKDDSPSSDDTKPKKETVKTEKPAATTHPSGLTGIDLLIWKSEQKDKNKE